MSKWSTDRETVERRVFIGLQHPDFDGPLDALGAASRANTADEVRPKGWDDE